MYPTRHCLAVLLTAGLIAATADAASGRIYRTVDEHGNVVFTDVPPREDQPAEQVIIETPNSFTSEEAIPETQAWIVEEEGAAAEAPFSYRTLEIVSPQDDEPVRANDGNVTVVTNISPDLQPGHVMRLLMDGSVAQEGPQTSFHLTNVDRGTHTLSLEIVDQDGTVLKRSPTRTFHLLRVSILFNPAPGG